MIIKIYNMKSIFSLYTDDTNINQIKLNHNFSSAFDKFDKNIKNLSQLNGLSDRLILVSPDQVFKFITIPKNASSSVRMLLPEWKHLMVTTPETLAIVRDPIDRWISGITQYLYAWTQTSDKVKQDARVSEMHRLIETELFLLMLFDFPINNAHTMPQSWFFDGYDYTTIRFYKYDSTVLSRVSEYVKVDSSKHILYNNRTVDSLLKMEISDKIRQILNQYPECKTRLFNLYRSDYVLFQTITQH